MYTIKRKFRDSITMIAIKTNIKILLTNPKKIHNKVNNSSSRDVTTYLGHFLVGGYRCLGCKFLLNKITNKRNNQQSTQTNYFWSLLKTQQSIWSCDASREPLMYTPDGSLYTAAILKQLQLTYTEYQTKGRRGKERFSSITRVN